MAHSVSCVRCYPITAHNVLCVRLSHYGTQRFVCEMLTHYGTQCFVLQSSECLPRSRYQKEHSLVLLLLQRSPTHRRMYLPSPGNLCCWYETVLFPCSWALSVCFVLTSSEQMRQQVAVVVHKLLFSVTPLHQTFIRLTINSLPTEA